MQENMLKYVKYAKYVSYISQHIMHNLHIGNMQNMHNMYLGSPLGASRFRAFSPSANGGRAPSTRRRWPIVQCSMRSQSSPAIAPSVALSKAGVFDLGCGGGHMYL